MCLIKAARCDDGLYSETNSQVKKVEDLLNLEPSHYPIENIPEETLDKAARMFIYLNPCFDSVKHWITFYKDLFQNMPPDYILLSLNRLLKIVKPQDEVANITKLIFTKAASILSLKYKEIRSMSNDTNVFINKIENHSKILEGGCVYLSFCLNYVVLYRFSQSYKSSSSCD